MHAAYGAGLHVHLPLPVGTFVTKLIAWSSQLLCLRRVRRAKSSMTSTDPAFWCILFLACCADRGMHRVTECLPHWPWFSQES